MKPGNIRKERNAGKKLLFRGAFIAVCLSGGRLLLAADAPAGATAEPQIIPLTRVNPDYPATALTQHVEGWVRLRFNLDSAGNVHDAVVVESCAGPKGQPCTTNVPTFADSALHALKQWTYAPSNNGEPRNGIMTIMRFQLSD